MGRRIILAGSAAGSSGELVGMQEMDFSQPHLPRLCVGDAVSSLVLS